MKKGYDSEEAWEAEWERRHPRQAYERDHGVADSSEMRDRDQWGAGYNAALSTMRNDEAKPCADCGGTGKTTKGLQGWTLPCASCATPQPKPSAAVALSTDERSELEALRRASAQYQEVVERAENLLALTADTHAWFAAEDALSEALKPFAPKGTSLGGANAEQPSAPASSPWVAVASGVMPGEGEHVWFFAGSCVHAGKWTGRAFLNKSGHGWLQQDVSHWMERRSPPTPAPPSDSPAVREP